MQRNGNSEISFDLQDAGELTDALKSLTTETKIGQQYKDECYTSELGNEHTEQILSAVDLLFPGSEGHATVNQLATALTTLVLSGQIQPRDPEVEEPLEAPQVDLTPRDKNGKPLTQAQLDWSEMMRFANESSMDAIRQRKHIDPKFLTFMATNLRREMQEQPVGDGVTPEGQAASGANFQAPTLELRDFARKYALEPITNLRPKGGLVILDGQQMSWTHFQDLLNRATAAGAIR